MSSCAECLLPNAETWPFSVRETPPEALYSPSRRIIDRLEVTLARPTWTERDARQVNRLVSHWYHWTSGDNDEEWDTIEEAERQVDEWKRILAAPPLPSTARLRRLSLLPDRETRARALARRIRDKAAARQKRLEPRIRPFKTPKAQANERKRVYGSDRILQRLDAKLKMLMKYTGHDW